MPPIHIMIKPVSGACNMHCRYCFYADEASRRSTATYGYMSEETVQNLVRKAFIYADGSVTFSFQGGEPTLAGIDFYKNFIKTVTRYNTRALKVSYALQTNGTLLNDELCSFFAQNGFLIGVSLDGTREIHNELRNNTYDSVIQGIKLLKKHNVDFNVLCVLTQSVAENMTAVWKTLAPYAPLQFIPCIDSFDGGCSDFSLDAESYGNALVKMFDLYRASFFSGTPVSERRMDNYMSMLLGYPPEHCGMSGACGLYFLCEADGSVFPCDFYVLDEWKLGNVNETSFLRMAKGDVMMRFQKEGKQTPKECSACEYFYLCRGGCRRDREPSLLVNRFCKSYAFFFKNRLDDMKKLAEYVK